MFFGPDIINTALVKQLDASYLHQKVISNNIANLNTPYFKKSTVKFEEALKMVLGTDTQRLLTTSPRHMPSPDINRLKPEVVTIENTSMGTGGNNVDIDQEMVILAKNNLMYNTTAQILNTRKSIMNYVVREGR